MNSQTCFSDQLCLAITCSMWPSFLFPFTVHFISINPVLSNHLSYVTIFYCSLGRSHQTDLTVDWFRTHSKTCTPVLDLRLWWHQMSPWTGGMTLILPSGYDSNLRLSLRIGLIFISNIQHAHDQTKFYK